MGQHLIVEKLRYIPISDISHGVMPKVDLVGFQCTRCDHIWWPRDVNNPPTVCPKCKSPYWDKPRQAESGNRKHKRRVRVRK